MKGFKDSTKVQYSMGGSCYAKGGSVKGAAKISKVMGEFKAGTLHSGSKKGPEVTNPKQATAIALSEARKAGAKIPVKKAGGGSMDKSMVESTSSRPTRGGRPMTLDEMQRQATPAELDRTQTTKTDPRSVVRPADLDRTQTTKTDPRSVVRPAELAAVARGNRMAREEASESRLVRNTQKATPRTREVTSEQRMGAKRVGPAFSAEPMFSAGRKVLGALGLKKGGLAVMPRGKKGC